MPTHKGIKNWSDAKKSRVISVDIVDLKKAVCKSHQECVIAKAIKRQTGAEWVDVGATTVLIKTLGSKKYIRYKLNSKARDQVKFFDESGQFAPCFVELCAPCPSLRIGSRTDNRIRKGGLQGHHGMYERTRKPSR